jgi:glycosyltransferase involved in cell wall biosynthesis
MKWSVVIPAFNEERLLGRTLEAVRDGVRVLEARGDVWEVIVCDNRSTDRTAEVAREHGARVVYESINQIARARNTGAAAASGEWLLFLDADTAPTLGLLEAAVERVKAGGVVAVGAVVRLEGDLPRGAAMLVGMWNGLSRGLRWMAGSFIAVEAAAFREVGGFNLAMYAGEELDLSRRLKAWGRKRGRRVVILRDPPVVSSARKFRLYTRKEWLRFGLRAVVRPWATSQSREACSLWYDGRR